MEKFIVKQNRKRQTAIAIMALFMVAMSVFILYAAGRDYRGSVAAAYVVGVVGTLFFGYGFYFLVRGLIANTPVFIVDEKGITDNSTSVSFGFVPWQEIESFYAKRIFTSEFICVEIKNYGEHLQKLNLLKRLAVKANSRMGYGAMSIMLAGTGCEVKQAVAQMEKYKPR